MSEKADRLGVEDPAHFFEILGKAGDDDLTSIRDAINEDMSSDRFNRPPKTWSASAAAELIGRSVAWLRENDPDAPKNEHGHARWDLERINAIRDRIGTRQTRPEGVDPMVLAFSKLKGGVGNSTLCAHFAHYCAIQELKVLAVDLDPQASLTQLVGALVPDVDLENDEDIPLDALLEEPSEFKNCIRPTYFTNVDLCPSNSTMQNLDVGLMTQSMEGNTGQVPVSERLREGLKSLDKDYDLVLVDCAPALGLTTANALGACNGLINPLRPSYFDRASYVMFTHSLAAFFDISERPLDYFRIVLNQCHDTTSDKFQENEMRTIYGSYVAANTVVKSAEIGTAAARLSTVYDLMRPTSNRETYRRAVSSLDAIFDELMGDIYKVWEGKINE